MYRGRGQAPGAPIKNKPDGILHRKAYHLAKFQGHPTCGLGEICWTTLHTEKEREEMEKNNMSGRHNKY